MFLISGILPPNDTAMRTGILNLCRFSSSLYCRSKLLTAIMVLMCCTLIQDHTNAQQLNAPWTVWKDHSCYKGLSISVKNMGFNKDNQSYYWGVRIKNNYSTSVSFRYLLSVGGEKENATKNEYKVSGKIKPGGIWTDGGDVFTANMFKSASDNWMVMIGEVCFEGMKCGGTNNCYADCDKVEKKINQPCGLESTSKNDPLLTDDFKDGIYTSCSGTDDPVVLINMKDYVELQRDGKRYLFFKKGKGLYNLSESWTLEFSSEGKMFETFKDATNLKKILERRCFTHSNSATNKDKIKNGMFISPGGKDTVTIEKSAGGLFFSRGKNRFFLKQTGENQYEIKDVNNGTTQFTFLNETSFTFSHTKDGTKRDFGNYTHVSSFNPKPVTTVVKEAKGSDEWWPHGTAFGPIKVKIDGGGLHFIDEWGNAGDRFTKVSEKEYRFVRQVYDGDVLTYTVKFINDFTFHSISASAKYYTTTTTYTKASFADDPRVKKYRTESKHLMLIGITEDGLYEVHKSMRTIRYYKKIAEGTYQYTDRPCQPECYKATYYVISATTLKAEYTNLKGEVNLTEKLVLEE